MKDLMECLKPVSLKTTYNAYNLTRIKHATAIIFDWHYVGWTAKGAEAVIIDKEDGQKYKLTIEPIRAEIVANSEEVKKEG